MTQDIREYMDERFERIERAALIGSKEALTLEEAAMLTGYKVKGIYTLTSEKRIPHYKKNGRLYFKKSELEAWMTENKIHTNDEIQSKAVTYTVLRKH